MNAIAIDKVEASPRPGVDGSAQLGAGARSLTVKIYISNLSESDTYYVISRVRAVTYASATDTIEVALADFIVDDESLFHGPLFPPVVSVGPGKERVLTVEVRLQISRLKPNTSPPQHEVIDLSAAKHMRVVVAYSELEPAVQDTGPDQVKYSYSRDWGELAERLIDI